MELLQVQQITVENLVGCRLNGKDLWIPKVEDVAGVRLVYLRKWDRGLTRFLTGRSLDLKSNGKNLNSTSAGAYLDDLFRKKREAYQAAVLKAHEPAHESDAGHEVKAKGKKRKVTDDTSCFSPLVQISLPAVQDPWMPERLVQVEFGGQSDLWIEVNETSLRQVVQGISECNSKCGRARTSKSEKIKPEPVLPLSPAAKKEAQEISDSPDAKSECGPGDVKDESCEQNLTPLAELAEGLDTFPYDSHEQNLRKHIGGS